MITVSRCIFSVILLLYLTAFDSLAQHKNASYELRNEIGSYRLVSLTFSHDIDNTEGVTFVLRKHANHFDTVYQIDQFLNGWVALSNDGQTVAHLVSEENTEPLSKSKLSMYRAGKLFDSAELDRLISYELKLAKARNRITKSGWLRNDSLYHAMATNPFYVTDDRLFISFDSPKLSVFDMKEMSLIYNGNGANHFQQNYYSLPNAPYRTVYDTNEYFPKDFPETAKGKPFVEVISQELKLSSAIPEMASKRAQITLKLNQNGSFELRESIIFNIETNEGNTSLSEKLRLIIEKVEFDTSLIPPDHPSWIFSQIFWLK